MNEVGGSESGTGLTAKSSRSSDANFEYDDSEWDVGIGNLIIDLDADIEKNNEANRNNNNSSSSNTNSIVTSGGLTAGTTTSSGSNSSGSLSAVTSPSPSAIGGGSSSSNTQMHIPLTSSSGSNSNISGNNSGKSGKSSGASGNSNSSPLSKSSTTTNSPSASDLAGVMEHSSVVDKGLLKMKIKRTKTGTKSGVDAKHEIVKNDVVNSSNGTSGGGSTSGGYSTNNKSLLDSISSKNSHSSHKEKDKLLIKDGHLHDNSHDSSSINNAASGNSKQDNSADHAAGGKVKTPRKGSAKEKKVKNNNSNVGNSGNSKNKEEKNSDSTNTKGLSNSGNNSNSSTSSGTHAKDSKEFFSTTVNLNVPNVIPNSTSSAFVKATATIKVPTAPSSSAASVLSSSSGSGLHNVHSSGGDSSSSPNLNSRSQNATAANNSSNNTPWGTVSPNKGAEKGRLSPSVQADKVTGASSYKKARAFAALEKQSGSNQDENSSGSQGGTSSSASYRNQGALSINSATDLSSSSSTFTQGVPASQSSGNGSSFSSSKETGKSGRNASTPTTVDVCVGTSVGTVTEPDCLGPCEPGTSVTLEGIVWHETESGVLVVNVTWRGKTYVGTLIDCTKNDWAPPRFCDSPTDLDLEMRTPKNRGKRGRAQAATPVNEPVVADTRSGNAKLRNGAKGRRGSNTPAAFVAPASPVKPEAWPKRKTRGSENETQEDPNPKNAKRPKVSKDSDRKDRRSNSPAPDGEKSGPSSPQLIECPEPNCSKKYKHINGLRYHQSHAHSNIFVAAEDSDSNLSTASNTNASAPADPPTSTSTDTSVEPMVVDNVPDTPENGTTGNASSTSATNSIAEDSPPAPPTPGKKTSTTPPATTSVPKVDDKIYDLSTDADLNPGKDSNTQSQEAPEPYKSGKAAAANKTHSQGQGKEINDARKSESATTDQGSKLTPENLSKDASSTTLTSTTSTPTTSSVTPTLTPRTPILTVPVVPYMSLQNRNLVHGPLNVPRVETSLSSRDSSENNGQIKSSGNQGIVPTSKGAPWQPHAHSQSPSGLSSHGSHVMNTSPPSQSSSITVPLNIPMNIPEKLGGGSKDKDKSNNSDQPPSKKNKHKKKSKDKDKDRDGRSKSGDKERQDMSGSKMMGHSHSGGPSDYSRSSGMFHNSALGHDSMGRPKDMGGDDSENSRKNSIENREDPQSPAYSDISDANDSGPDNELNVGSHGGGSGIKDSSCKGLVIPGEIKKDPLNVPGGVPPAPPFQSYINHNHNFHSPYLDSLSYAANSARQGKDSAPSAPEDVDKDRSRGPVKHPIMPPTSQPVSTPSSVVGNEEARRSPKIDYHSKYPFPNYFSYPFSGYGYPEHSPYGNPNALQPENSFGVPGQNRMFPGIDDRDKEGPISGNSGKSNKSVEKDEGPGLVQIKQEPIEREERRSKDRGQSSSVPMNLEDKHVEIKSEFGTDHHNESKLVPPYMNSSSKHMSKDHKSSDDRHERRHDKDHHHSKSEKSSRNSASSDKNKSLSAEEPETKERKDEGAKPTMETTGPPPPPTASAYYLPQTYLPGNPFGLSYDHPLYRQVQLVPGPYPGSPYIHPGSIPRFPTPGGPTPLPEDLSRPSPPGPPGNSAKALDLLQHHAAQYYTSHKIHELQERALKSPSPQVAANQRGERDGPISGPGGVPAPSPPSGHPLGGPGVGHSSIGGRNSVGNSGPGGMPKPADLSKDAKPIIGPGGSIIPGGCDNVRTPPPTQHHVHSHTHHHTHVGIGYPIIPTVPPQYSPHYGVLATPPAAPSVIPPFPSQKPN